MSKGYNVTGEAHAVKDEANRFVIGLYAGRKSENAVILPSVTCNDVRIAKECGIFTWRTRYRAFERGGIFHNGRRITPRQYLDIVEGKFNDLFGEREGRMNEWFQVDMNCDLKDCRLGYEPGNLGKFDFANYDTCSSFKDIDKWLPHHMDAYQPGSPMIFTFDADYSGRLESQFGRPGFMDDTSPFHGALSKWFGYENIMRSCHSEEHLRQLEDKCNGMAHYLEGLGIRMDFVGCYREDAEKSKVMMLLSGTKR